MPGNAIICLWRSSALRVVVYCTIACSYCRRAIQLLEKRGANPEKIYLDEEPERRKEMLERTKRTSVPQIFIGDRHIGGYTELVELDVEDELEPLLAA